ncbi:secretory carrier-associated membrane protein 2 isoform X6 [Hydra vulgaris]|uniref:Secretory carrier-associated membrane protein n=1 Tax=Hydra vulgaris TaxID=6087 RepID=A0ABM4DDB9_HYDVU
MSGRDINPFADPKEINPFAASPNAPPSTVKQVNDYNPFADDQTKKSPTTVYPQTAANYGSTPANLQATRTDLPPYSSQQYGSGYSSTDAAMKQRQEELERKAAELDRKEQELQRQQNERIVYIFTLFFNLISALAYLVTNSSGATVFGVSILYLVLFAPCSFICWYRPIYKALKSDSSFSYMLFFVVFFIQIILCGVYSLGISVVGTVGWINGAAQIDTNKGVSAMMFITAALWTVDGILMALLLQKVHSAYRRSGASFEKAQGEFARGIASNKNVQNAAAEAVKGGFSK